jgi:Family of unknown function (DUF6220)
MPWAKTAFTYLALLLGALVVVQFFLAGYGVIELGGKGMKTHETVGHIMEPVSLLLLIFGLLARYRGALLGMTIAVFVLIVLQSFWANADASVLRALHVLGALSIAMILREIVAKQREQPAAAPA